MAEEEERTQIQRNKKRGRRLKPRSKVWDHFTRHTGGDGNETAKCNRCGKVYAYHGTKNLWEHLNEGCGGQESGGAGAEQPPQPLPCLAQDEAMQQQFPPLPPVPLPPPCAPSPSLQEEACKHLARMIALRGYDASVLEDDCFRSFVRSLNPTFEMPSRVAVEEMCDGIFDEARRDILDRLRRAPGKVSVAAGPAKTMEEQVFYVACHFIDDGWNLHNLVLHAFVTTDHHDANNGAILGLDISIYEIIEDVNQVISDHGIDGRLFMVAYETIDKDIHPFSFKYSSGPGLFCTNPNRKAILSATYVDNVLHSIARCFLPHDEFSLEVARSMEHLLLTRQGRVELFAELGLQCGWAYDEHWYAYYCSLRVLCTKVFPLFTDEELVKAKLLCKLWEKIYRAIQKISSSSRPTGNLCLSELLKLMEVLLRELAWFSSGDRGFADNPFHDDKDVMCVLKEAIETLDKAIKDSYLTWSLPFALDPRYKLDFITNDFKRVYGLEAAKEYVSKVTTMIRDLYAYYVKEYDTTDAADHADDACSRMDITTSSCRSNGASMDAETDLDRYLRDSLALQVEDFDILSWWKAHSSEYPMVARMARDALAMPTCSKLSSDQMAQVKSILRGYSEEPYRTHGCRYEDDSEDE